jgi:hypothetical protein
VQHDLDQLRVGIAGVLDGLDVGIGNMAAGVDQLDREANRRVGFRIGRAAGAVGFDFGVGQFREVLAQIGMRRKAIIATVDLGDCERDAFAGRSFQRAFGEGAVQPEISFERGGTVADQAKQVRHHAELFFDSLKQRLGGGRRGFDRSGGGKAGHDGLPFLGASACSPSPQTWFASLLDIIMYIDTSSLRYMK